jgi:predicted Rossmann-fold nucleotide-binding protein
MKKRVTVFGSAFPKDGETEYAAAYKIGCLLAQKGFDINTGGYMGIIGSCFKRC